MIKGFQEQHRARHTLEFILEAARLAEKVEQQGVSERSVSAAEQMGLARLASIIRSKAWRHMGCETSRGRENQTLTGDDDRGKAGHDRPAAMGPVSDD